MLIETVRNNIISVYRTNRDNYTPSYYFYNEMARLIGSNFINFCNKDTILELFDNWIIELENIVFDFDFPEENPGPLFYLNTDDAQQVFLYLETNMISIYEEKILYQTLMTEMQMQG